MCFGVKFQETIWGKGSCDVIYLSIYLFILETVKLEKQNWRTKGQGEKGEPMKGWLPLDIKIYA